MKFEDSGLPEDGSIRKAFEIVEKFHDKMISKMGQQFRAQVAQLQESNPMGAALAGGEEDIDAQLEKAAGQMMAQAVQTAKMVHDKSSLANGPEDKRNAMTAAALLLDTLASRNFSESILEDLPESVSGPVYEMWSGIQSMMGGQNPSAVYDSMSEEGRLLAFAHIINSLDSLSGALNQSHDMIAMMGEIPPQMRIPREALSHMRDTAKKLGEQDAGLKKEFDARFQGVVNQWVHNEMHPPQRGMATGSGEGGVKIITL